MKTALMLSFLFLGQIYNIELAITPIEQATGLMYRKKWTDESQGMLFINDIPREVSFWMKNTYLNLTLFYLDADFNILEKYNPQPLDESPIISESQKIQYILELNPFFEENISNNWESFKKIITTEIADKYDEIKKTQG